MSPTETSTSQTAFLAGVVRSGLMDQEHVTALLRKIPLPIGHSAEVTAEYLVRSGVLSRFQAQKLLAGAERGLVLGPYRVLAPLGRGGMGTVYLARDSRDQRLVALKVLPPQKYREEERLLTRFQREMQLSQKLWHSHITRTYEAGVSQHVYYIAMEYVPGETLKKKVVDAGPLPISRAARTFVQVTSALAYAHGQGLIHRDLKPSNIMITPNAHAKILDLGLALIEGEDLPTDKSIIGGVGYVVGTMDFIAPEQVEDPTKVDARADLYSLGCSLYYVLTAQVPFPGGTTQQKIKRHLTEWPEPVADLNPTVPVAFATLIERLMEKRPENRPSSAEEVQRLLLPWFGNEPVLPMDMAVDNANPREIIDLREDEPARGTFWESVSGTIFVGAKTTAEPTTGMRASRFGISNTWLLVLGLILAGGLIGLFAVGTVMMVHYWR